MRNEKSCGVIIFMVDKTKISYLLLYGPSYWGFVKGLVEKDETEEQTAVRETEEEVGMKIKILDGFKANIKYMYKFDGELINKEAIFFVAEAKSKDVRLSDEHDDFKWVDYNEALSLMKFKNQKEILENANTFIQEWVRQKRLG